MVAPERPPRRYAGRNGGHEGDTDTESMGGDERGQALTLEAITAAILLLSAVGFALQMTSVTPLSASTSSQHLENQLQATGEGVLASADDRGALTEAVLEWNASTQEFHDSGPDPFYRSGGINSTFGQILDDAYGDRNIAYNVIIHYHTPEGGMARQRMVHQGEPSDHAVSASRSVVLLDSDRLIEHDGSPGPRINETNFYAPDAGHANGDHREQYNLLRVEVIAWRI